MTTVYCTAILGDTPANRDLRRRTLRAADRRKKGGRQMHSALRQLRVDQTRALIDRAERHALLAAPRGRDEP